MKSEARNPKSEGRKPAKHKQDVVLFGLLITGKRRTPRFAIGDRSTPFLSYQRKTVAEFKKELKPHLPDFRGRVVRVRVRVEEL